MSEVSDNGYHRGNHRHDTNPETAHTKPAIFDSHFYFLTLPRRLVIRCNAARGPGAPYWFHFSLRELEPSANFFHRWLAVFGQPNSKPYAQFPQASQLVLTTLHPTGRIKLIRKASGINAHPISSHPVNIFQCLI
jgi:hypothetical protein